MAIAISVDQLVGSLRGQLIQAGDADYEDARRVFNAMIDRRPRFIVRCADVADVMACVNYARQEGLVLSVRGGGHNVAGFATNDGGLVIDLSRMKGIRVDPRDARSARRGDALGETSTTPPTPSASPLQAVPSRPLGSLASRWAAASATSPDRSVWPVTT